MAKADTLAIRKTAEGDLTAIAAITRAAFGRDVEAYLALAILVDQSARPDISLIAIDDGAPVGHVLLSRASLIPPSDAVSLMILAPLSVVPDAQGRGIGGKLIEGALRCAKDAGVDLIFLIGNPAYYRRHGFEPAARQGLAPPFPLEESIADAWMVCALRSGIIGTLRGCVRCCDALNKPELWREESP